MMTNAISVHLKKHGARSAPQTSHDRSQRGQSSVEIALLLPILLLILFGIIIVGFMFYAHIQVSNAVREGARAGSVYRTNHFDSSGNTLSLATVVQKAIYDPSATPPSSALGSLPASLPSFSVTRDVSCVIRRRAESYAAAYTCAGITDPRPGDRLQAGITYSYTMPVVSVMVPMFQQPFVMQSNVMMEIQ